MPEFRSTRVFAVTNQKGGVGKTTTAINLATALAMLGRRTLIIDLDPQGNASTGLGIARSDREISTYDLILGSATLSQAICPTSVPNMWIVPATVDLSSADVELYKDKDRIRRLSNALDVPKTQEFDYILIDCPPSLNLLTINALVAADGVLVPLQCEFFALEGLSQLLQTIREVREAINSRLRIQGVVLTMYDKRNNLSDQVANDVRENLGALVFDTVIPRNVRLSEAPSHALPALVYDSRSAGSIAYQRLAAELLRATNDIVPA